MKESINSNAAELRDGLKSSDLLPIDYPECDKYMVDCSILHSERYVARRQGSGYFYRDVLVYDTDDNAEDYSSAITKRV